MNWEEGDSIAVCEAILISYALDYMRYTDEMLHILIHDFRGGQDEIVVAKFKAELARRKKLEE